jgi:hypothetical protein
MQMLGNKQRLVSLAMHRSAIIRLFHVRVQRSSGGWSAGPDWADEGSLTWTRMRQAELLSKGKHSTNCSLGIESDLWSLHTVFGVKLTVTSRCASSVDHLPY